MTILKALAFIFLFMGFGLLRYALMRTYDDTWSSYFLWLLYLGGQMYAINGLFSPIIDPILSRITGSGLSEGEE